MRIGGHGRACRQWCLKFGQPYANALRRRRPRPGDKWHLDEVFVSINGVQQYLWRAVDQDGNVLDILVQARRDKRAAVKFLRKLSGRLHLISAHLAAVLTAKGGPLSKQIVASQPR